MSNKVAYVSVTYLYTLEPNELGLDDNCSKEELKEAADEYMNNELAQVYDAVKMTPNDVEIEVVNVD